MRQRVKIVVYLVCSKLFLLRILGFLKAFFVHFCFVCRFHCFRLGRQSPPGVVFPFFPSPIFVLAVKLYRFVLNTSIFIFTLMFFLFCPHRHGSTRSSDTSPSPSYFARPPHPDVPSWCAVVSLPRIFLLLLLFFFGFPLCVFSLFVAVLQELWTLLNLVDESKFKNKIAFVGEYGDLQVRKRDVNARVSCDCASTRMGGRGRGKWKGGTGDEREMPPRSVRGIVFFRVLIGVFVVFLTITRFCDMMCVVRAQQAEDVSKLQQNIKPYLLRRMKEDVEKAVPPKEETIIEVQHQYKHVNIGCRYYLHQEISK